MSLSLVIIFVIAVVITLIIAGLGLLLANTGQKVRPDGMELAPKPGPLTSNPQPCGGALFQSNEIPGPSRKGAAWLSSIGMIRGVVHFRDACIGMCDFLSCWKHLGRELVVQLRSISHVYPQIRVLVVLIS